MPALYNRSISEVFFEPMMIKSKKQATEPRKPADDNGFSLISEEKLLGLYTALLQCHMLEEHMRALLNQYELSGGYCPGSGQEASAVGVAIDLLPEDTLALCCDNFSVSFVRGVPLRQLYTLRHAPPFPRLKAAVRTAFDGKMNRDHRVAVVFCGALRRRGEATQSLLSKTMLSAGTESLPMVFVRHGNSDAEDPTLQAWHYGFPRIIVDGNDVVAIYRVASEAIAHARRGNGPTLIVCRAEIPPHAHVDRGRLPGDPILNMESYLNRKGLFTAKIKAEITANFKRKLQSALHLFAPGVGTHE